jgi:hypothetical protein
LDFEEAIDRLFIVSEQMAAAYFRSKEKTSLSKRLKPWLLHVELFDRVNTARSVAGNDRVYTANGWSSIIKVTAPLEELLVRKVEQSLFVRTVRGQPTPEGA